MLISGFFCGFSIANAVYYSTVMKDNTTPALTVTTSKTMMIINIIISIIMGIVFIWFFYRLVFSADARHQIGQNIAAKYDQMVDQTTGYLKAPGGMNSFTSLYNQVGPGMKIPTGGASLLLDPAANS
jgi:hypothetical protein